MIFAPPPPPPVPPDGPPADPSDDDVGGGADASFDLSDRVAAFVNMGFDELEALALAWDERVSVSQVRELIRHGCAPRDAARIVL